MYVSTNRGSYGIQLPNKYLLSTYSGGRFCLKFIQLEMKKKNKASNFIKLYPGVSSQSRLVTGSRRGRGLTR